MSFCIKKMKGLLLVLSLITTFSAGAENSNFLKRGHFHLRHAPTVWSAKQANMALLPATSMNYVPDNSGGWLYYSNSAYTYNSAGKWIENKETDPTTGQNIFKKTNGYDSYGNLTEIFNYLWLNNNWALQDGSQKVTYFYNGSGQITEQVFMAYDEFAGEFVNDFHPVYIYDSTGKLTENILEHWNGSGWEVYGRFLYSFGSGNFYNEEIFQEYLGGVYLNKTKMTDIVWYDPAQWQMASFTGHIWNGNTWVVNERGSYTYDQYGGTVELIESYSNTAWIPKTMNSYFYDVNSNYIGYEGKEWNGTNWEFFFQDQEVLTYNSDLYITERVFKASIGNTNTLEDIRKEVYANFIAATDQIVTKLPSIELFPNPGQDQINIVSDITGSVLVFVRDLTGRLMLTQEMPQAKGVVDISKLKSGTYLLSIQSNTSTKTLQVKKH